ncbi:MAG: TldD/PmbA family protein [candidate division WOR-3 bacterium]
MLDEMKKILTLVNADYADLRYERMLDTKIDFDGKELTLVSTNVTDGYVLRVLKKGGLATVAFTKKSDAKKAIKTAEENAELIGKYQKEPIRLAKAEVINDTYKPNLNIDPREVKIDEKLTLLTHYNQIPYRYQKIATTQMSYEDKVREKYFVNTEGTQIEEDLITTRVIGSIVSQEGTLTQRIRVGFGGSDGYARVINREAEIEEKTKLVLDMLKAKPVTAGNYRVILNQRLAGVFTHEAFGHFSEADIIEESPSMRQKLQLGAELGTPILNIKDDPTQTNQLGHYKYDDEGVRARPTRLLKNGVLVGRLHSRRTAAAFSEPLTGHAIAEDYRYPPIIRMGSIYIEPGQDNFEDLLAKLGDGLYLLNPMGGQTSGENFTFAAQYGYEVKNGKMKDMIRDINISGNLYQTLKNISAIANDLVLGEIGGCGKGQTNIRSCYGAPHILIESVVIGGR